MRRINLISLIVAMFVLWSGIVDSSRALDPPAAFSSTSGSGPSFVCASGDPTHCARRDRAIQAYTLLRPPPVGAPFINQFGEREVRVTGPCTATKYGSSQFVIGTLTPHYCNYASHASGNDSASQIGLYDSTLFNGDGGYRAVFVTDGGAFGLFAFDRKTLQARVYGGAPGADTGVSMSHTSSAVYFDLSGTTLQASCFPDSQNPDPNWGCTPGASVTLYNFSTCPNLPVGTLPAYNPQIYSDRTDTWIIDQFSINQDQNPGLVLAYNTSTLKCVWFNPATFQYGGTGLTTTKLNGGPFGDSTAPGGTISAPTLATGTGSITGTAYVEVSENPMPVDQNNGWTTASPEHSIALSAEGLNVSIPACSDPLWCTGGGPYYRVYAATSSGGEALQDNLTLSGSGLGPYTGTIPVEFDRNTIQAGDSTFTAVDDGSGNLSQYNPVTGAKTNYGTVNYSTGAVSLTFPSGHTVSGSVYVEWGHAYNKSVTYATLATGTASPPITNTAGTALHAVEISPNDVIHFDGNGSNGNGHYFWTVGTSTFNWCGGSSGSRPCYGHLVMGNSNVIFPAGPTPPASADIHFYQMALPFSNLGSQVRLLSPPPGAAESVVIEALFGDTHYAWSNDNATDTVPFLVTTAPERAGVTPVSPLQLELWSAEAEANQPVYRYAFSRATETAYWGPGSQVSGEASFWDGAFGAQSPDGKFALFSTNWDTELGWNENTSAWVSSAGYSSGSVVTDANGNLEIETVTSCTSGSGAPSWPSAMNGRTADNNCSWTLVALVGHPFAGLVWTASASSNGIVQAGYYIAGVYLIDSNGNLEEETAANCVAGTSAPTWNATTGGTTTDGACSWTNLGSTGLASAPAAVYDRQDIFIVELN